MSEAQPEFLSLQNAALRADVSTDYLRDLIADGTLPAYRLARKEKRGLIRVKLVDVDGLLRRVPAGDAR